MLKERADLVTRGDHGAGVVEVIEGFVTNDLATAEPHHRRHDLSLGLDEDGQPVTLPSYGVHVLLAGPSGGGKSTMATVLLERLIERGYQFCLLDPGGDYEGLEGPITLGGADAIPSTGEILQVLRDPAKQVTAILLGVKLSERPAFLAALFPHLQELSVQTGRPHWLVIDEAHHLAPATWDGGALLPGVSTALLAITHDAPAVARPILDTTDVVIAVGEDPDRTLHCYCEAIGHESPQVTAAALGESEALVWFRRQTQQPVKVRAGEPRTEHRRHVRKYIEGDLSPALSFYFRGPKGTLNLRAQNLAIFTQIADGVVAPSSASWRLRAVVPRGSA